MSRRLNLAVIASLILHAAVLVLLPMLDGRPPPKPPVQMTARLVEQPRPAPAPAPAPQPPPPLARPEPKPAQKPVAAPRPAEPRRPVTQAPPVIAVPAQPVPQPAPPPSVSPQPAPRAEPPVTAALPPAAPSQSTQPSSASSASSAASVASDATTIAQFRVQLIEFAGRYKRYPRIAQDNNWTGTAEVRLAVGADGAITALSVRRASGHAVLDNEALSMIRTAFGKLPVPDSLRGKPFSVDVPVVFSLKDE